MFPEMTRGSAGSSDCLPKKTVWCKIFYRPDSLPVTQPTISKHRRNKTKH